MRVAYLINQYPKVSHSFIRREIRALELQGLEVMRISLRGWDDPLADPEDFLERKRTRYVLQQGGLALLGAMLQVFFAAPRLWLGALPTVFRLGWRAERPFLVHLVYFLEACRIALWLRREKVHHIHAHFGTNSAEVAMLVHVLTGVPWSFTVHGPEEFDKVDSLRLAQKIRSSRFVVAISSFGRSQLYRLVEHRQWAKIHLVHCGLEDLQPTQLNSLPVGNRLVCVGRLSEQKGQLLLIEAARHLAMELDLHIVLVGDGELRSEIEGLVTQYNLNDKITITGWLSSEQVLRELSSARALVLPSFAEGLPIVIMEAMAMRRPVISTFVGGIPELVVSGKHGWLVPAGDVVALTDAIRACVEAKSETLLGMGDEGYARVRERHDIRNSAAQLASLYRGAAP